MPDDLISKRALLKKTRRMYAPDEIDSIAPVATACVTVDDIHRAAVVDAVPVVHGRWVVVQVWKDNPQTTLMCSQCKTWQPIYEHDEWKFCPFCGIPMDAQDMDVHAKEGGAE